jgi:hypothetical protein
MISETCIIRQITEYHDRKLNNESGGSESKIRDSHTHEMKWTLRFISWNIELEKVILIRDITELIQ